MIKFLLLIVGVSVSMAGAVHADQSSPINKDIDQIMTWMEGEFDNYNQVYFQTNRSLKVEGEPYDNLHHYRQRIESKKLPGNWLFAQANKPDKGNSVYRQIVMEFFVNDAGAIVSKAWKFRDASLKQKGVPSTEFLNQLSISQLELVMAKDCLTYWQKRGAQYVGEIDHLQCTIQSKYKDEKRQLFSEELVFDGGFWMREGAYQMDGKLSFGLEKGQFYQFQKARNFSCQLAINTGGKKGKGEQGNNWKYTKALRTDDVSSELIGDDKDYRLQLRQTRLSEGNNEDALEMFLYRAGDDGAMASSRANPAATMIGINLREVKGECHLVDGSL